MLYEFSSKIVEFFSSAQSSVVVVAPYIKTSALIRILDALPKNLKNLEFVTRWNIHDIASGGCDLEILEHILDRGATLKIHPHVHAKYYRVDDCCIVGSANLTARGFGWSVPANVELIVGLPADHEGLTDWELRLLRSSIVVDEGIRDTIKKEVEKIEASNRIFHYTEFPFVDENGIVEIDLEHWLPSCPVPERLWDVYRGGGEDVMVQFAYETAQKDLVVIAPPKGLPHPLFIRFVRGILCQLPLICQLNEFTKHGLPDHEAIEFLANSLSVNQSTEPERAWRILKDWFMFFFPNEYRIETQQQVLIQGRNLEL